MLVQQLATPLERHPERLVLGSMPTHRRLHDQPSSGQEIQGRQLLGQQQRVAQRRDDRARHHA
jgi:hypothetical protein